MSNKIRILFMFGIVICSRSSDKFCLRRYVNGKWISTGDCVGSERVSKISSGVKLETENKGWTVFQRRKNGNVNFYRDRTDYVKGFGNADGDFWLGLETMHQLTKRGDMEMEIKMISRGGIYWVADYRNFRIGPGSDNYRLHVSWFSGNATYDALARNNNLQFSTKDADHDGLSSSNCASEQEAGWWYGGYRCGENNLNGDFHKTGRKAFWWRYSSNLLRFSEMKIRKRS